MTIMARKLQSGNQALQVGTIATFFQWPRQFQQLISIDEFHPVSHFFDTADFLALALLNNLHKR